MSMDDASLGIHLSTDVSFLRRDQRVIGSFLGESMSSIETDDYGEYDLALQSYRNSTAECVVGSSSLLPSIGARELLRERLIQLCASSSEGLQLALQNQCVVVDTGSHKFEVSVNVNKKALTFATIVYKLRQQATNKRNETGTWCYSLMTTMMKHNAIMSGNTAFKGHRVGVYDGTFSLFTNISLIALSSNAMLKDELFNFALKAGQISDDFATTKRLQRSSRKQMQYVDSNSPGAKAG